MGVGHWWERRLLLAAVLVAVAVPLLWPVVPPLLDLPGHMASYHVALDLARTPALQRFFAFEWRVIGNLGVDVAIMPIGHMLGVEPATKLIAICIPVLTALGFLLVAKAAHGRVPPTVFVALPLAYNYPLLFGFVNYCLALAIALLAFAWWLRWPSERRPLLRALVFATLAALTWLSHAIGWLMLGVMCTAAELQGRLAGRQPIARALGGAAIACFPLLAAVPLNLLSPHIGGTSMAGFFKLTDSAKWTLTLLRDRWMWFDLASVAGLVALVALAVVRRWGLSIAPRLGWPALAMFLLFLAAPQSINDSFFVSSRIMPYAAALALLAIRVEGSARRRAAWAALCVAFLAVRLGGLTISFLMYDRDYRRQLAALDYIPRGATVAAFAPVPCESGFRNWYNPRTYHLTGLAVVRRDAFINATWSIPGLQLLRVHYPQAGAYQSDPSDMVYVKDCPHGGQKTVAQAIKGLPPAAFDRLWLVHVPPDRWPEDHRFVKLWSGGDSVVYRILPVKPS